MSVYTTARCKFVLRHQRFMGIQSILGGLVLVCMLTLMGHDRTEAADFAAATAADLSNRSFTFASGAAFGLASESSTLTFENVVTNGDGTGPFTLASASGTATGTVTIPLCHLAISSSTFDAAAFPGLQPSMAISLNRCDYDSNAIAMRVQNSVTGAISASDAISGIAFVLTSDFATGSASVINLTALSTVNDVVQQGSVHSDALARAYNGFIYVVNRLGQDNITRLDPQQNYMFTAQESVGNGTNPQDIVVVNSEKAYVSRLASAEVTIIHPATLLTTGSIDLSPFVKANDTDGVPEAFRMLLHGGMVYLILQHLDNFTAVAPGEIAVIDPTTDTVTTVVALTGNNPLSDLQFSADLNRILVSTVGSFGVNDGGIEAFNPATNTVDAGFIINEATIGGDITFFNLILDTKGFAIISDASFANSLVSFDPSTGRLFTTLVNSSPSLLSQFAINQAGELYLASPDTATPTPGVRIFNTAQDTEMTTAPLNVGSLPPNWVVLIEP